jgi:hypothetical protein
VLFNGIVEGLNNNAKVTMTKYFGFRTSGDGTRFYDSLGKVPKPHLTRRFLLTKQRIPRILQIQHRPQSASGPIKDGFGADIDSVSVYSAERRCTARCD